MSCEKYFTEADVEISRTDELKQLGKALPTDLSLTHVEPPSEDEDVTDETDSGQNTATPTAFQATLKNKKGQTVTGPNTKKNRQHLHNNVLKRRLEENSFLEDPCTGKIFKKTKIEQQTIDLSQPGLKKLKREINLSQEEITPEELEQASAASAGGIDFNFSKAAVVQFS